LAPRQALVPGLELVPADRKTVDSSSKETCGMLPGGPRAADVWATAAGRWSSSGPVVDWKPQPVRLFF